MRVPFLAAAILVFVMGCGGQGPGATAPPGPVATSPSAAACSGTGAGSQVSIAGLAFGPAGVTVGVGGEVTWTNADSTTHTVTFDDIECGRLSSGATVSRTFDAAGTFAYHCGIHPSMRGTVTVQ